VACLIVTVNNRLCRSRQLYAIARAEPLYGAPRPGRGTFSREVVGQQMSRLSRLYDRFCLGDHGRYLVHFLLGRLPSLFRHRRSDMTGEAESIAGAGPPSRRDFPASDDGEASAWREPTSLLLDNGIPRN
jgi:hypothetical protein